MKIPVKLTLAATAAGALVLIGSPATAAPNAATAVSSPAATTTASQAAITDYWTADRMHGAAAGDVIGAKAAAKAAANGAASAPAKVGTPTTVPSTQATTEANLKLAPVPTIGKVFFTLGGLDYVCSGNVVSASNSDVVSTAGHCVNEGPGDFATNWAFVPAYDNGDAPYGTWTARTLVAPSGWVNSGDINVDTGFAVMNVRGGQHIAAVTGSTGVAFNQSTGLSYTLRGYPAAAPFDGETLQGCSGTASADTYGGTQSQGVPCDMTGGSSGGPWFLSSGVQNSINSFGYDAVSNTMFGPYWGSVIQGAYDSASTA